jgi:hypothetical protein
MNHSNRGSAQTGDQYALSLLVNAAEGRDPPRQRTSSESRFGEQQFNLRALGGTSGLGGADASLEEQLVLQQQAFGSSGNGSLANQLREQNLLSQLNQQQQLAALLGLGGTGSGNGSWNSPGPELRQALAAAQFRQNQLASQLTQADILGLSRSGGFPGLLGGGSGSGLAGFGGCSTGASQYRASAGVAFGGSAEFSGSQAFASELDGLQRLEELNRRKRLLAVNTEGPRLGADRGVATAQSPQIALSPRVKPNRKLKTESSMQREVGTEELAKLPGSVIVPCRARGMPMDHNFKVSFIVAIPSVACICSLIVPFCKRKTAYFVIPENVKHGEELICSYFACRNAGIKFRYCSHCKVPVAKRNFRKRHKHGGEIVDDKDDDSGDDETQNKGIPYQITASREEEVDEDGISSQSADSTDHHEEAKKNAYLQDGILSSTALVEVPVKSSVVLHHVETPSKPPISADRQARWMSLLAKRPSTKDSDTMSGWLMEVLAVSDLETLIPRALQEDAEIQKSKEMCCNGDVPRPVNKDVVLKEQDDGAMEDEANVSLKKSEVVHPTTEEPNRKLLKKKRASDVLDQDETGKEERANGVIKSEGTFGSGSFAEWKERKKQKMQSKGITSPGNSGVSSHSQSTTG